LILKDVQKAKRHQLKEQRQDATVASPQNLKWRPGVIHQNFAKLRCGLVDTFELDYVEEV